MTVNENDFKRAMTVLRRLHRKGELPGLERGSVDHHVLVQEVGGSGTLGMIPMAVTKSDGAAVLNFFDDTGKWTGVKEVMPRARQMFQIVEEIKQLQKDGAIPNQITHIDVPDHENNVPRLLVPGNILSSEEEADRKMDLMSGMAARAAIKRGS